MGKSLLQTNYNDQLPLHCAENETLQSFRIVLDYGIHYFPSKRGISLLFQKDGDGETPIQDACKEFERKDVISVVEEIVARYSPTTPINSMDLLMLAAIGERTHLDGVY